CMAPIYFILAKRYKLGWLAPHFAIAAAFSITGPLFMDRDIFWNRVPALQSPWFVPHVFAYMVSYALAAVAFAITIGGIVSRHWKKAEETGKEANASYLVLLLAYPFMTFGMLSGALWAEEAWGIYWSWDAKETWALITWTAYLIYFHCRMSPRFKDSATLTQVLAFIALLITFFVVNLLPKMGSLLHSYA
ncbi:MAG: cytochrome c biogenesis protein CcsA, partial [Kiritimatiellales bacterium]|nr:cytochrome c biogenesis protein CcsA [Kiritimatiellales bacterium]